MRWFISWFAAAAALPLPLRGEGSIRASGSVDSGWTRDPEQL